MERSTDWVRRAGQYRVLTGKRDLDCPLSESERLYLAALEFHFRRDEDRRRLPFAQREQLRAPIAVPVRLGDFPGTAQDISGDGIYVVTAARLALGTRTVVSISGEPPLFDEDQDCDGTVEEWQFSAEVVRTDGTGLGLRFVGIPVALRIWHRRTYVADLRYAA